MMKTKLPAIAAAVHANRSTATCARLLALAGLEELLEGEGQYTLFAPTDVAFSKMPSGELASLRSNPAKLRATLAYHILHGFRELSEIHSGKLPTLEGTRLTSFVSDEGLRLDHSTVLAQPLLCANGVIYQIDAVLMPGFTPSPSPASHQESAWSGRRRDRRNPNIPATVAQAAEALFGSPTCPPAVASGS